MASSHDAVSDAFFGSALDDRTMMPAPAVHIDPMHDGLCAGCGYPVLQCQELEICHDPVAPAAKVGQHGHIGGYSVVRKLGQGTSGVVYLCTEPESKELCCIKCVELDEEAETPELRAAMREMQLLEALQHTHVIGYRSFFKQGSRLQMVMEFAAGGDLERLWLTARETQQHFEESRLVQWMYEISLALEYVHGRKVLHRDLKLANIFLDAQQHVKIGDFGLARTLGSQSSLAQTMCGTPYYISPELCGGEPYGSASDMWACGCVMYELATLKRPFEGTNLNRSYDNVPTVSPG